MEKVKLNELADIYLGVTHTPEYVFEGVPFLSVKDISGGKICFDDCKYISQEEYNSLSEGAKPKVGDMLFCRVGTLGKPIIIPEGTPLFGSFVSLGYLRNKDEDRCNLNYLRYWMYSNSFWKQVNSNVKGASQVNLNTGWLSKFDIDLPDINEQKYRISVLDKCKTIIEQREAELGKLDNLIKARFVELFGDCKTERLGDFCSTHARIGWQKLTRAEFLEEGDYYLITGWDFDVKKGEVDFSKCFYVTKERYEQDKKLMLKVGDVLLTKDGTLGKVAMVKKLDKPATLNGHIFVIRSLDGSLIPEFLVGALSSDEFKRQMEANKTGSTIVGVTQKALLEFQLPVAPMELQNQFADFVKQVDKSKVVVQKALEETQLLFDSLMQKYFG